MFIYDHMNRSTRKPRTKIINTISAVRQCGRAVSYKVPKWQNSVTYRYVRHSRKQSWVKETTPPPNRAASYNS